MVSGYQEIEICSTIEELIKYALVYNYDFKIPDEYKVTTLYNIIHSCGNFMPDERDYTTVVGSVIYTTTDKKDAESHYKKYCKRIGKKNSNHIGKYKFCWQSEDIAINQIVHSYCLDKSYLVEKYGSR